MPRSQTKKHSLKLHKPARAHLIGIAGAGMRSLADVLYTAGWTVSGSDSSAGRLVDARFKITPEHHAIHIDESLDLVVYSPAVQDTNPELQHAKELGLDVLSYPEMLGRLMSTRNGIAIAGTHGKSTTTAMATEILLAAGLDPTVIYGAAPLDATSGGRLGQSRWMLAEACEYRAHFCALAPQMAVILGIEHDHFDCFNSLDDVEQAFARFAGQLPPEGLLLARGDCASTARSIARVSCAIESFGLTRGSTWHATAVLERRGYYSFQIRCHERRLGEVKLRVPGRHNMLNALAAAALASHCGASGTAIRLGLERFAGLKRRLELVAETRGITVLDDYAHHPTEIAAALTTVRQMYPGRRVCCVLEPHQVSRMQHLLPELAHSLENADKIIVSEIFRAREPEPRAGDATARDLADRARSLSLDAVYLSTAAEIRRHLNDSLQPGDVLITLGAGDIGSIAHDVGKGLRTLRKAS